MLAAASVRSSSGGRILRPASFSLQSLSPKRNLVVRMASSATDEDAESSSPTSGTSDLCHRLADQIINGNNSNGSNDGPKSCNPPRLCLAIAGGGSPALSALTSTPNASRTLVEGIVTYDRRSFADFVGSHPPPASADVVSKLTAGDGVGRRNSSGFSFSSGTAAHLLASAALHRALQLSPSLGQMRDCAGVGCASALVSQGRPDKMSRAHVVVMSSDGGTVQKDVVLSKEKEAEGGMTGTSSSTRRTRREEDELVGGVILSSVLEAATGESFMVAEDLGLDRDGDDVETVAVNSGDASTNVVEGAAESIVTGRTDAVVLIPNSAKDHPDSSFAALGHPVLPPNPLIFPGSYNPPHIGHVALAQAAVKTMMRKRAEEHKNKAIQSNPTEEIVSSWGKLSSTLSDNTDGPAPTLAPISSFMEASTHGSVWGAADHEGDDESQWSQPTVLFEMSLTNADKPPMEVSEATRRINMFDRCLDTGGDDEPMQDVSMPDDWGVLLTSAPLFVQKVGILGQYVAPSSASIPFLDEFGAAKARRKMTFIIGTDTMVRIINPKYYGDSIDDMVAAVREMGEAGVHFVVGGRLEQGKGANEQPKFITGEEELESLPTDVRDMFTIIQEEDFRLDLSSTELRKRAGAMAS